MTAFIAIGGSCPVGSIARFLDISIGYSTTAGTCELYKQKSQMAEWLEQVSQWNVLSWSEGYEFEPRSGWTWGAWYEVTDDRVVRADVSVTWNVLSWSGGYEFEPWSGWNWSAWYEVTDGWIVRADVSVTWNVLSWSGGYEFEPWSGWNWSAWYFCPKSY